MAKQSALRKEQQLDQVFHALADPSRRRMVVRLVDGPASVSELAKPLKMALPTVMQHLKVLEDSGLVVSRKEGRVRTCAIEPKPLEDVTHWLEVQRQLWEDRFDRLDSYLEDLQSKKGSRHGKGRK